MYCRFMVATIKHFDIEALESGKSSTPEETTYLKLRGGIMRNSDTMDHKEDGDALITLSSNKK